MDNQNQKFMKEAIKQAKKAYEIGEVPVGAVIVKEGKIIARAYNKKEIKNDATMHAEIIAIKKASKKLKTWRLNDCDMYVTLEPCAMCAGAIVQARIKNIYFGAKDVKNGACESMLNLFDDYKFNYHVNSESGICEKECSKILKSFFKELRKNNMEKYRSGHNGTVSKTDCE